MTKQITFEDICNSDASNVAFDYLAIVEKIQTWNISNDLNMIDHNAKSSKMTREEIKNSSFSDYVDKDQQILTAQGQIKLGSRRALVSYRTYNNDEVHEGYRTWKIQSMNKDKEWYTSDNIYIHSKIRSMHGSQIDLTIQSNSRDLAVQLAKQKFPQKYGAPALFKISKSKDKENVTVNCTDIERHRWQLQDELIMYGASFDGSGKVFISIPKGKNDDRVKGIMGMMRKMYGFNSKATQDDSSFYIETSEYTFKQLGLTKFIDEKYKNNNHP